MSFDSLACEKYQTFKVRRSFVPLVLTIKKPPRNMIAFSENQIF